MASKIVTFTYAKPDEKLKKGSNSKGDWTLHEFRSSDNEWFVTFKEGIATVVNARLNEPLEIEYDDSLNDRGYPKNSLEKVKPAQGAAVTAVAPDARQSYEDKKQATINRSAALARAIETVSAEIVTLEKDKQGNASLVDLFSLADAYVPYIDGTWSSTWPSDEPGVDDDDIKF